MGLKDKPKSGKPSRLSNEQKDKLKSILQDKKPDEYGYNTGTWNGPILIDFVKNTYAIEYKKAQIYNVLKSLGCTYQKGRARYPEADEQKRDEFKKTLKKTSRRT